MMTSVRYLARQGIALKGNEENLNFTQFLNLCAEDDDNLKECLLRKSKEYTLTMIQNEILKDMAIKTLSHIVNSIKDSGYYSIMADESSDISNVQQFVICIRQVDNMLEPHEDFTGLHTVNTANVKNLRLIFKRYYIETWIKQGVITRAVLRWMQCNDG